MGEPQPKSLTVRDFRDADAGATARLFYETVRRAAGPAYDERQRAAWAPEVPEPESWRERLGGATTLVAEDERGVAGFMSLAASGYLDLAFVRVDRIGSGVAGALYRVLLERARRAGLRRLHTDASARARGFFERRGWSVVCEQHPVRRGVRLVNYRMEIVLERDVAPR